MIHTTNIRAAIYLRVSSEEQVEKGTIANQREFGEGYTRLHEMHVYDWYTDEGVSGVTPLAERPEGSRLLRDAQAGHFNTLLIYRIDRLGRNLLGLLQSVASLEEFGVTIRSMTEPFDTGSPLGRFVMSLLGSLAELERETIVERATLGRHRAAREGRWIGGRPPLGYVVGEDQKLAIEPAHAAIVQRIFALYLEGMTTTGIALLMNAEGFPTPRLAKGIKGQSLRGWNQSTVWRMLTNRLYTGAGFLRRLHAERRPGKKSRLVRTEPEGLIPFSAPILIDTCLFDKAQSRLQENATTGKSHGQRVYLLTGKMRCGLCGRRFVGGGRNGLQYGRYYYRCISAFDGEHCGNVAVPANGVEGYVLADLDGFIKRPLRVIKQLDALQRERIAGTRSTLQECEEVERRLVAKKEERGRIIGLIRRGLITDTEGEAELLELQSECRTLEQRLANLRTRNLRREEVEERLSEARDLLQRLASNTVPGDPESQRLLISVLVEVVTIRPAATTKTREPHAQAIYIFDDPAIRSRTAENTFGLRLEHSHVLTREGE